MKREDAEEFTQSLGQIVAGSWRQVALAKRLGVPKALGLSVEDWVQKRLGGYVRMSIDERREAARELAADGQSTREIAAVLGVDHATAARDISVANATDGGVTSLDNRSSTDEPVADATTPIDAMAALAADEKIRIAAKQDAVRAQRNTDNAKLKAMAPPPPEGKYSVVVIDPPWPMEKIERDVAPNQAAFDYPTMSEDELAAFPIPAADDCHLFCWTTHKFLPMALRLLDLWGFRYVCTFVWHKAGGFQPFGLPQYNCEFVLYARKGTPEFAETKAFSCCFDGARREHSRKPDEFYNLVRRVTAGPRIDVFSRERRDGFDQQGNEVEKFAA